VQRPRPRSGLVHRRWSRSRPELEKLAQSERRVSYGHRWAKEVETRSTCRHSQDPWANRCSGSRKSTESRRSRADSFEEGVDRGRRGAMNDDKGRGRLIQSAQVKQSEIWQ
jgi:hypothetical protein